MTFLERPAAADRISDSCRLECGQLLQLDIGLEILPKKSNGYKLHGKAKYCLSDIIKSNQIKFIPKCKNSAVNSLAQIKT